MSYENNVPELRFEEFDDEWEEVSFKDLGSISMCKRIYKYETSENHEIPFYKIGTFGKKANTYISNETYNQYKELYPFPSKGDVLISAAGTIGRTVVYDGTPSYFQDSNIIWLDHTEENVLNEYLKHFYEIAEWDGIEGSTIQRLYNDIFLNTKVCHPDINEQNQIAKFLTNLKDVVDNKQKELTKLQNFKQAMLQNMFPKEGEKLPELRFEGFQGDWEVALVKDIYTITRGDVLAATKTKKIPDTQYKYPVYSSQTKNDGFLGYYNKYLFENAITWTTDGANAGTVSYRHGKFYSTNVNGVLLNSDGFVNKAMAENINNIAWKHVTRAGNPKLMNNVMGNIKIRYPTLDEQNHISVFFINIDKNIKSKQAELTKLKQFKQATLNKMFV